MRARWSAGAAAALPRRHRPPVAYLRVRLTHALLRGRRPQSYGLVGRSIKYTIERSRMKVIPRNICHPPEAAAITCSNGAQIHLPTGLRSALPTEKRLLFRTRHSGSSRQNALNLHSLPTRQTPACPVASPRTRAAGDDFPGTSSSHPFVVQMTGATDASSPRSPAAGMTRAEPCCSPYTRLMMFAIDILDRDLNEGRCDP